MIPKIAQSEAPIDLTSRGAVPVKGSAAAVFLPPTVPVAPSPVEAGAPVAVAVVNDAVVIGYGGKGLMLVLEGVRDVAVEGTAVEVDPEQVV